MQEKHSKQRDQQVQRPQCRTVTRIFKNSRGGLYGLTKKGREAVMGDGVREVKGSITGHCKDFIFTVREMENTGV